MAVSIDLGVLFLGSLAIRTLRFGVCIRAVDFWKLPHYLCFESFESLEITWKASGL